MIGRPLIRAAWHDSIEPGMPLEMHIVEPSPPVMEPDVLVHVIIVQAPREEWVSCLVTVFDSFISRREHHLMRLAVTTFEHIQLDVVLRNCGLRSDQCDSVSRMDQWSSSPTGPTLARSLG